jgi:hypothetical protein
MRQVIFFLTAFFLMLFASVVSAQNHRVDSVLQGYDRYWEMKPGLYRVMEKGYVGVVDSKGREVVPCRFDQVWTPTKDNYIRVLLNMKTGLYHLEKGIILPAEYDQIWEFENGVAKVMKGRKFGYVNTDGRMVVPCEFQHIWSPENGKMKVIKDGLTGYIGTNGEIVVPVVYQQIWSFENGLARVIRDGKMGYIDEEGNEVVPAIYDQVWPFVDGKAMVVNDGKYFMVNPQGKIVEEVERPAKKEVLSHHEDSEIDEEENHPHIRIEKDRIDIWHDGEGIRFSEKKRKHPSFDGHLAGVGIAMNGYLNADGKEELPEGYDFMELNHTKSLEVSIYPVQESLRLIGRWFGLITGIGIQYNNYRFDLEHYADIDEAGREWFPEISEEANITKSKLMMMHVNVPVMVEIQIPNRYRHNAFFISGGIVGGARLQTHTKVVFNDENGEQKRKKRDDMGIPAFRYGFMAMAGYGEFSLYATYYPESMFKDGEGPELYPYSVGMMFIF